MSILHIPYRVDFLVNHTRRKNWKGYCWMSATRRLRNSLVWRKPYIKVPFNLTSQCLVGIAGIYSIDGLADYQRKALRAFHSGGTISGIPEGMGKSMLQRLNEIDTRRPMVIVEHPSITSRALAFEVGRRSLRPIFSETFSVTPILKKKKDDQ